MTPNEALAATFAAVCALAERITGEKMHIQIMTEQGPVWFSGDSYVRWISTPGDASPAVELPERAPKSDEASL